MESKKGYKVLTSKSLHQKSLSTEILALVESGKWEELWKDGSYGKELPIWFLEYSVLQNCFHIDTLDRILYWNRDMAIRGVCTGYVVLEGPIMWEELKVAIKKWKPLIKGN